MLLDAKSRRSAEIGCQRQNFPARRTALLANPFGVADPRLREGTGCADRKQFRRDPDKSGKKQLLAIEFGTETRHGVK